MDTVLYGLQLKLWANYISKNNKIIWPCDIFIVKLYYRVYNGLNALALLLYMTSKSYQTYRSYWKLERFKIMPNYHQSFFSKIS